MKLLDTTPSFLLIFAQEKASQQSKIGVFFVPKTTGVTGRFTEVSSAQKVPQISFSATSAALSNKASYPFFLRTLPPVPRFSEKKPLIGQIGQEKKTDFFGIGADMMCVFFSEKYISIPVNAHNIFTL